MYSFRHKKWLLFTLFFVAGCPHRPDPKVLLDEGKPKVEAILINGGNSKNSNYQSHLQHIRKLSSLLMEAGLTPSGIHVFSSDGSDPALDLATRDPELFPNHWMLYGSRIKSFLANLQFEDSKVDNIKLLPAKKASLETWFHIKAGQFRPGDTLLVYVTDHGVRAGKKKQSAVSLWGEKLLYADFVKLLDQLDPKVRVVMLMSQCYSGGFANTIYQKEDHLDVRGNVCGMFSTLPDRLAWGCFPESRDQHERIGHSFRLFEELAPGMSLGKTHDLLLITDQTPNVPNRSSDFFLRQLLLAEAKKKHKKLHLLTEDLLKEAWADENNYRLQKELLDELSLRLDVAPVRYLEDLSKIENTVKDGVGMCKTFKDRWKSSLKSLTKSTVDKFLKENSKWDAQNLLELSKKQGLKPKKGKKGEENRIKLTKDLLSALSSYVKAKGTLSERLDTLQKRKLTASAISVNLQTRQGLVLRIRSILDSVAGEVLARKDQKTLEDLKALRACEDWTLPQKQGTSDTEVAKVDLAKKIKEQQQSYIPLPPLEEDLKKIDQVRPGWLGVGFGPESKELKQKYKLTDGALVVRTVYDNSPALDAGFAVGDTIIGLKSKPFKDKDELRETVMLTNPGKALNFEILREGKRLFLSAKLVTFPKSLPSRPKKLTVGKPAPAYAKLKMIRGGRLPKKGPLLLFFFATWCKPCKRAVPDLIKWEEEKQIPVIAVSAEESEKLNKFLDKPEPPFIDKVAQDPRGLIVEAFRVTSYPVFVLIGEEGNIHSYQVGAESLKKLTLK
jgi:thiol-disulfide isomerase/thioredoxin